MDPGSHDRKHPQGVELSKQMKSAELLNSASSVVIKNYRIRMGMFPLSVLTAIARLNDNDLQNVKSIQAKLDGQIGELLTLKWQLGKLWPVQAETIVDSLKDESIQCGRLIIDLTSQIRDSHGE